MVSRPMSFITSSPGTKLTSHSRLATFNALCILCGATALHRKDRSAVVPDLSRLYDMIGKGLNIIHDIATVGSAKAQQSERFLQQLVRATVKRDEKVCITPISFS